MATTFHIATFLLFAAVILLLVSTISSPVINDIAFLKVYLATNSDNGSSLTFGTFGYCLRDAPNDAGDLCSGSHVGYQISDVISANIPDINYDNSSVDRLTKALILQPVALGIAFIAFLIAAFSTKLGFLFASSFAFFAFIVSLVLASIELGLFISVRNHVINSDIPNVDAELGVAIWLTVAAMLLLLIGSAVSCFTCCFAKAKRNTY